MNPLNDIAVVGMSCVFPGAKDLNAYWNNIINKVDAIREAPEERIAKIFYDPESKNIDRFYCNRGGFVDEYMDFDPIEFGIVPNTIEGTEPEQLLSLKMTYRALEDADVFQKNLSLKKAGIIIGRGNYGGIALSKVNEIIFGSEDKKRLLKTLQPDLHESYINDFIRKYQSERGNFGSHNVMGTVPNLVSSLIANRLDFGGPAYTIDAACASSVIAIDHAIKDLALNRCDIMIAGGIHLTQSPVLWSVFSTLGAFSKSQVVRPFDKNADGALAGEGCGFVVLRRLEDAIRDNHRIYAVIKGIGVSSDGSSASLMSPAWEGQTKALNMAWDSTALNCENIGYIEAHGTATVLGDKTELQTLGQLFPYNSKLPTAGIGSVKSMIGHAMPASGIAGFIKTVMALHKGILPPTLHCEQPVDALKETRFMPVQEATEWKQTDLPFTAGVNAFGFGGANSHVILQKFNAENTYSKKYSFTSPELKEELVILARNNKEELIEALKAKSKHTGTGKYRLAIFNPNEKRIEQAIRIIQKDIPWRNKQDMWFTNQPLLSDKGKLVFLFPGLDFQASQGLKKEDLNELTEFFGLPSPQYIGEKSGNANTLALDESCRIISNILEKLDVTPDMTTGHSMGELTACAASGMVDEETIKRLNEDALARNYEKIDAVFLSVCCSLEDITSLMGQYPEIHLSNDNCYNQIVLCARRSAAEEFKKILDHKKILSYILPFETGYHSPFLAKYNDEVRHYVENIVHFKPAKYPIWSCITSRPYPTKIKDIQQLHVDFITKPVRFRSLIENLHSEGATVFIQIGAGSLTGFVSDILKDKNYAMVSASNPKRSILLQLKRVLAALFIEGKEINKPFLGIEEQIQQPATTKKKKGFNVKLDLSYSLINYNKIFTKEELQKFRGPKTTANNYGDYGNKGVVIEAFNQHMEEINLSQQKLLALFGEEKHPETEVAEFPANEKAVQQEKPGERRHNIETSLELSLEKYPELIDHCPFRKNSKTDNSFNDEREPVVPFTFFIELFMELFRENFPDMPISKCTNLKIYQFFWVKEPQQINVVGKWINDSTIRFEIKNYISASITSNSENSINIYEPLKLIEPEESPIKAEDLYEKRYMFHGPAYQGIKHISGISKDTMKTTLVGTNGKGALLDNMGQIIGLFYHLTDKSIFPFPVGAQEITFFQPMISLTGEYECICTYKAEDSEFLYSNIELKQDGKRVCYIKNWQNRKSELDSEIWKLISETEKTFMSKPVIPGLYLLVPEYRRSFTWFMVSSQYLNRKEAEQYEALPLAKQKDWLFGRIAAKDAIRNTLNKNTEQEIHPASFSIVNNEAGKPEVISSDNIDINISISHKRNIAIAMASTEKNVGVDIEEIRERDQAFTDLALHESEKLLFNSFHNKGEWITRIWTAKEAYGKYIGKGLNGNPKKYTVSSIEGDTLIINSIAITTLKYDNYIIAHTN